MFRRSMMRMTVMRPSSAGRVACGSRRASAISTCGAAWRRDYHGVSGASTSRDTFVAYRPSGAGESAAARPVDAGPGNSLRFPLATDLDPRQPASLGRAILDVRNIRQRRRPAGARTASVGWPRAPPPRARVAAAWPTLAGRHPGPHAPEDHRPVAGRRPADGQRGRHRLGHLQRRDLQLPRAAPRAGGARATASARTPTPRSSSTATRSGATSVVERLDGMFAFGRVGHPGPAAAAGPRPHRQEAAVLRLARRPVPVRLRDQGAVRRGAAARGGSRRAWPGCWPTATRRRRARLYRGVQQLPPAHRLVLARRAGAPRSAATGQVELRARRRAAAQRGRGGRAHARRCWTEAVRKRLVADVPVGAFLSGGLDSTIVVGLMARHSARVRTFSHRLLRRPPLRRDRTTPAWPPSAFGTEHTEFQVTPARLRAGREAGLAPRRSVRRFVGHPHLRGLAPDPRRRSRWPSPATAATSCSPGTCASGRPRSPSASRARCAGWPAWRRRCCPAGTGSRSLPARARRMLSAIERPLGDRLTYWNSYFAFTRRRSAAARAAPAGRRDAGVPPPVLRGQRAPSPLAAALDHNFGTYLPYDLLVKVDRISMAHALETRSPFLDTALIEYVAGSARRVTSCAAARPTTKYILRQAFADLMPPAIRTRGKMGFGLPLGTWFRSELRTYIAGPGLCPRRPHQRDLVRPAGGPARCSGNTSRVGPTTSTRSGCC